jgi:NAD(P)-dependent dehydrogenase (short-subunit alcohol dehydrogenase family)
MKNVERSENGKIIALSSKASSFGERLKIPMMYSYAMSKTALNSMIYSLSFETKKKNVVVISLSPGMVNTTPGISLPSAIEIDESVTKMMAVIENLTMEQNGLFIDYEDGRTIPW